MSNGTTFPSYQSGGGGYKSSFDNEKTGGDTGGWKGNSGASEGGWKGNNSGGQGGWKGGGSKFPQKPKPEETDPTLYLSVAFMGNKEPPEEILSKIRSLIPFLESKGFTIRTGADGVIEETADAVAVKKEFIIPWKGFNEKESPLYWSIERAHHIAKMFHPTYDQMKKGVHGILAKNARMVMGHKMMSPATLFIVWTPDGVEKAKEVVAATGFSGHAIKIACAAGVPVFNLGNQSAEQRVRDFVANMAD